MDMKKWFKEAQYGMMAHWGLYSMLASEWRGKFCGSYAEWIQANLAIPNADYGMLAKAFNPVYFDADEWIRLAKDCGMKYFVITSKHHDGFAMFHSKVDKYNVVDATPFGRDVIGELAEACYKHGLKMGFWWQRMISCLLSGMSVRFRWESLLSGQESRLCWKNMVRTVWMEQKK